MKDFSYYLDTFGEVGLVERIHHPIVLVEGLPFIRPYEVVVFETGQIGQVFTINQENVEILVFSSEPVRPKTRVARTNVLLSIPVGNQLLGTTINPLGEPLSKNTTYARPDEERIIHGEPLGIKNRQRIKHSLSTGVAIVDMLIPIGKGQKELVIGDRKIGKSNFLLATIKSQVMQSTIAIYAAIGRKKTDIKKLEEVFKKEGIREKVIIVATTSSEASSLIYLTPYSAMTMAEFFRDQGIDVLVVFDDMTTHAKFYREISLLARRFPGRDSYPGDIFYTHARLLERAGNFKHNEKDVSITCLPVVETVEGDLTSYMSTNLMSITDGHIFFDSNLYYEGRRPAINPSISVTRVGRQTQSKLRRDITRELESFFAIYNKMKSFSHFGAELTASAKQILKTGEKITKFFDQSESLTVIQEVQLILFALLWSNIIEEETYEGFHSLKTSLTKAYEERDEVKNLFQGILVADSFNKMLGFVNTNKEALLLLCKKTNS